MPTPRTKPSSPTQLLMPLDSDRLRGMTPRDRQQVMSNLAILLTEATRAAGKEEHGDER